MAIFRKTALPGTGMGLGNRTGIAGATRRPTNKIGVAKSIQPSGKIGSNKIERFVGQGGRSQDARKPAPGRIVASIKMTPKLMQHSQMSRSQSQVNRKIK